MLCGKKMTQLELARKGNITEATQIVAEEESISTEQLQELVSQGKIVRFHC